MPRPVCIHHCTSLPYRFFGRQAELALLDRALAGGEPSVVALVGPGGQGKTAIVQHWLERHDRRAIGPTASSSGASIAARTATCACASCYAYAEGLDRAAGGVGELLRRSAAADRLRRERWAVVLDGTEVVQHEAGAWCGRFVHPGAGPAARRAGGRADAGRRGADDAAFRCRRWRQRRHARLISLSALDADSAAACCAASACAATATRAGRGAPRRRAITPRRSSCSAPTWCAFTAASARPAAAAARRRARRRRQRRGSTASPACWRPFRRRCRRKRRTSSRWRRRFASRRREARLLRIPRQRAGATLLHETWGRTYPPFAERPAGWLARQVQELVELRLLERVGRPGTRGRVGDRRPSAGAARLRARRWAGGPAAAAPRRAPASCAAGPIAGRRQRWRRRARRSSCFTPTATPACGTRPTARFVALDNPKHRFLAPALRARPAAALLSRAATGGSRRSGPASAAIAAWRSASRCSASSRTPWTPIAPPTPPCAAMP